MSEKNQINENEERNIANCGKEMKEYSEEVILIKFPIIKKEGRYEINGLTTHLNMPQYEVKLKLSKQKLVVEKEKNQ